MNKGKNRKSCTPYYFQQIQQFHTTYRIYKTLNLSHSYLKDDMSIGE